MLKLWKIIGEYSSYFATHRKKKTKKKINWRKEVK